jgi:uncharacterized protein YbjT (DUF2867 family)
VPPASLGTHLVPLLLAAGHSVRAHRPLEAASVAWASKVEFVQADLKDREAVRRASRRHRRASCTWPGSCQFKNEDGRKMYELHVDCDA